MDVFTSAAELLRNHRPERPVLCLRPHAAARAARWFLANFPGEVLYAAKANDASPIIGALAEAGITKFDVASSVEIARMAEGPNAELYFMNPVKSRVSIRTAFDEFGVRNFAFDSEDELDKILEETGRAGDLALYLRIAGASVARAPGGNAARHHLPHRIAGGGAGSVWRGAQAGRSVDSGLRRAC
jgi:ornithine decarboxylase